MTDITTEELTGLEQTLLSTSCEHYWYRLLYEIAAIKIEVHRSRLEQVLSVFEPGIQHGIEIDESNIPKNIT